MNRLRRIVDRSPLRRVLMRPQVRRFGATVLQARYLPAAWHVTTPWVFLLAELKGTSVRRYSLRRSGSELMIDHGQGGLELLAEIFLQRCYDPPPTVAERIPDEPNVLDLGANVGAFVVFANDRWPGARVTAVEADPRNADVLRRTCNLNLFDVDLVEACASVNKEALPFVTERGAGSLVDDQGGLLPAVDVLPMLESADLAKIDIEGSEWPILLDPRFRGLERLVLVMEFHNVGCPELPAATSARRLLENAGFAVSNVSENYWGHGTLWATKP